MIKVNLICMGNLKEKYLRDAAGEYAKRLSRYCELTVTELSAQRLPDNPSPAQISAALEREAHSILKSVPENSFTTALCIEGKKLTSEQFADKISSLSSYGKQLTFIIGSSYGLSPSVKQAADLQLSASDMTFPHQLFRIMLMEQLYRAFLISCGGKYHK